MKTMRKDMLEDVERVERDAEKFAREFRGHESRICDLYHPPYGNQGERDRHAQARRDAAVSVAGKVAWATQFNLSVAFLTQEERELIDSARRVSDVAA